MNEPIMTVVGNLTADPELHFTQSGAAVANFTVAATPRRKDGDEWVDGEPVFLQCSAWRDMAENVAESLTKGQRVLVTGRFKVESYTRKDGTAGQAMRLDVDEVGHSLRFGSSRFTRSGSNPQHSAGGESRRGQSSGRPSQGQRRPAPSGDPWANAAPYDDEPPF